MYRYLAFLPLLYPRDYPATSFFTLRRNFHLLDDHNALRQHQRQTTTTSTSPPTVEIATTASILRDSYPATGFWMAL